jgi:hypothetical protein
MILVRWMGAFGHAKGLRDAVQFELATDRQVAVEPCIYGQTKLGRSARGPAIGLVMDDKAFAQGFLRDAWTVKAGDDSLCLRATRNAEHMLERKFRVFRKIGDFAKAVKSWWNRPGHAEGVCWPHPVGVVYVRGCSAETRRLAESLRDEFFPGTALIEVRTWVDKGEYND